MTILRLFPLRLMLLLACLALLAPLPAAAQSVLADLLPDQTASDLVPGAEGFGPIRDDVAAALRERLSAVGGLAVDVVGGGQPRYLLLLGCE